MRRDTQKNAVIAVAVVVIIVGVWLISRSGKSGSEELSPSPSVSASTTPKATVRPKTSPTSSAMPQSYQNALTTYANRRMQFDQYCQAQPSSMSVARGQSVMLDNRSGDARTFAVGGVYFTLPGYGWKIFTPSVKSVPATLYVDCGSARNVGAILVQ